MAAPAAAPITGMVEPAQVEFHFDMKVTRVREAPRVTRPFSDAAWEQLDALGERVDRDLIARDIYRGFATPQLAAVGPASPDYLTAYDVIRGSGIAYDPDYARHAIAEAMTAAGATLVDGRWTYSGAPVTLIFIARVEDARRRRIGGDAAGAEGGGARRCPAGGRGLPDR